jgi:hypothetical protein
VFRVERRSDIPAAIEFGRTYFERIRAQAAYEAHDRWLTREEAGYLDVIERVRREATLWEKCLRCNGRGDFPFPGYTCFMCNGACGFRMSPKSVKRTLSAYLPKEAE